VTAPAFGLSFPPQMPPPPGMESAPGPLPVHLQIMTTQMHMRK
jgi:hypothetical protein